jgi:DNA-binding transcriptional ArsR family regulator
MAVTRNMAGWVVCESAALELDQALALAGGGYALGALSADDASLVTTIAPDWQADWQRFLGRPRGSVGLLEWAADLADVLGESDYGRASLAMRTLSQEAALARLTEQACTLGLEPPAQQSGPAGEHLAALSLAVLAAGYGYAGLPLSPGGEAERRLAQEAALLPRILAGGDLHAYFWHWLDRFYYEFYQPWRRQRADLVARLRALATLALGAKEKTGAAPDLAWLAPQNPLLRYPELQAAVQAGRLSVVFWAEPFGLADSWALLPGTVAVSFAQPGARFEHFQEVAGDLARRTAALADPTRLVILRLIRNFGMINTEIAGFLQLSRPTVSIHAKLLREAGLISSHQEGRLVRHEIDAAELRRLFHELEHFLDLPPV